MSNKQITSWLYGDNRYNSYIIIYDPGEDIDDLFRAFDGIQYAEMMTLQRGVGMVRIALELREGVVNGREHYLKGCEDYNRLWKYLEGLFEAGHFQKLEAHLPWAYWMVNRFKEDIPEDQIGLVLKAFRP